MKQLQIVDNLPRVHVREYARQNGKVDRVIVKPELDVRGQELAIAVVAVVPNVDAAERHGAVCQGRQCLSTPSEVRLQHIDTNVGASESPPTKQGMGEASVAAPQVGDRGDVAQASQLSCVCQELIANGEESLVILPHETKARGWKRN